ncbi:MAG: hypothetical protein JSV80_08500 [Acidobacteriota bacterium]|nr:MAG: hypothetical protein JSV80_08500 [Acidobacteriota bacterium]
MAMFAGALIRHGASKRRSRELVQTAFEFLAPVLRTEEAILKTALSSW